MKVDGWVDAVFATVFLLLLGDLVWPLVVRGPAVLGLPLVAVASVGDPAFWPRLRRAVMATSLGLWIGGACMHGFVGRAELVTQPLFAAVALGIAAWARWARPTTGGR